MGGTVRVLTIRGIPINVHVSWLVIYGLFTWTLAVGYFPRALPNLPAAEDITHVLALRGLPDGLRSARRRRPRSGPARRLTAAGPVPPRVSGRPRCGENDDTELPFLAAPYSC